MNALMIMPKFRSLVETCIYVKGLKLTQKEAVVALARHGQTFYTGRGILQAWKPDDDKLTFAGEMQARFLQDPVIELHPEITASSEMTRAKDTLKLASCRVQSPSFACLNDIDYGSLRGMTYMGEGKDNQFKLNYPEQFNLFRLNRRRFAAPGGESYLDFEHRVREGFSKVLLPMSLGKISFFVSHIGAIREILFDTVFNSNIELMKPDIDPASLTIIHFKKDLSSELLLLNNADCLDQFADNN